MASTLQRVQASVMVGVVIGGLALCAWWIGSLAGSGGGSVAIGVFVVCAGFLVAGLIAARRRPSNPTGALMIAFGLLHAGAFGVEETMLPWRYTVGLAMSGLDFAILALLVVAFPYGRLVGWWDRLLVFGIFAATWLWKPFELLWSTPGALCATCPPAGNTLFASPAPFDFQMVDRALNGTVRNCLVALVLVTIGVRFVRASPPARRTLVPLLVPAVLLAAKLLADRLVIYDRFVIAPEDETTLLTVPNALLYLALPLGFLAGVRQASAWRGSLGDLVVSADDLAATGHLRDGLVRALHDPSLQLGVWTPSLDRYVGSDGRPLDLPTNGRRVATPVAGSAGRLAVLIHDASLCEHPGVLESATAAARLALDNERLRAEVRAQLDDVMRSRTRIVEATDAERRRIERDLHDGAQQRLVTLRIALRILRDAADAGTDRTELLELIEHADAETRAAIDEVRDLARGILPSLLADEGLAPALEALADRAPVRVVLGSIPQGRLPTTVEVAAYFVCSEAIANAAKHAQASRIRIDANDDGTRLSLTVGDDGCGGARLEAGSGLRGLTDRVEALGGQLIVRSTVGHGTELRAEIPLTSPADPV